MEPSLRKTIRLLAAGKSPWPLFLWGEPGTGKSCAALCLLDRAGGFYFTAGTLAEEVLMVNKGEAQYPSGQRLTPLGFWREIMSTALVVIDEVGTRSKVGDWQYDCLKRVLDAREGMPLVVIANHSLADVASLYDDRVASRLAAGTVHQLQGEDRRLL